MLKVFNLLN